MASQLMDLSATMDHATTIDDVAVAEELVHETDSQQDCPFQRRDASAHQELTLGRR